VILENRGKGQHRKYLPYVFTEQAGLTVMAKVEEMLGYGNESTTLILNWSNSTSLKMKRVTIILFSRQRNG
jgi:hypothetical protein